MQISYILTEIVVNENSFKDDKSNSNRSKQSGSENSRNEWTARQHMHLPQDQTDT